MIAQIIGELISLDEGKAVVQIDSIAYELLVPASLSTRLLGHIGRQVTFHTLQFLEGASGGGTLVPRLVGFFSVNDRDFFLRFISVQGIGYKAGLKALSASVSEMASAIERGDERKLASLPGIGKRTAAKIIAELKGKVGRFALIEMAAEPQEEAGVSETPEFVVESLQILDQMEYRAEESRRMIAEVLKDNPKIDTAEELVQAIFKKQSVSHVRPAASH